MPLLDQKYFKKYWIGFFLFFLFGLYAPLQTKVYTLHSPIPEKTLSIALLADLHSSSFYYQDILDRLHSMQPCIIALAGDIIDDQDPEGKGLYFLEQLKENFPHTPIYFVMGNHEFHALGANAYRQIIESMGIKVLGFEESFEIIQLNGMKILIAGVQDPSVTYYDLNGKRLEGIEDKDSVLWQEQYLQPLKALKQEDADVKILLTHRAEFVTQYAELPFDVILSGHAHGGQVRIPFLLNGLYAPNQGVFPSYAGGLYDLGRERFLVVSRGLSLDLLRPRIFNPPEIVEVKFQ